jgi:hypothetical protein
LKTRKGNTIQPKKKEQGENQILIGQRVLETGKGNYKLAGVNASLIPKKR